MHGSGYWLGERIGGSRASVWLAVVRGAEGFRLPVILKRAAADDPRFVVPGHDPLVCKYYTGEPGGIAYRLDAEPKR